MSERPSLTEFVSSNSLEVGTRSTLLWGMTVEVTFEADNPEDAAAIAKRITERVIEHPAVWDATGDFEPEQKTETVDV